MGAPRDEYAAARYDDVQVQVTLTQPFEIGRYEVTNEQWLEAGLELPARDFDVGTCREAECPISNINFFEAVTFANRYSELRGLEPCYELRECTGTFGSGSVCNRPGQEPGTLDCDKVTDPLDLYSCQTVVTTAASVYECSGYRLPTEAEWEYAARAGTRTAFWTGDITPQRLLGECTCDTHLDPIAWYCHNAGSRQHPVGGKLANGWGLFDVLGNVEEWTSDVFYGMGYGESPLTDPAGHWWEIAGKQDRDLMPRDGDAPDRQRAMIMRGGSHLFASASLKVNRRNYAGLPEISSSSNGLRLVRTLF